ncbi:MAG: prephenate dehydratase [Cyclobacteriaceae bacterium]|nr:prephenate dehydratase [Cyclobacteriaceae bacterium]
MITVGIQGIKGCFHEMAARKYFNNSIEIAECKTFKDLCHNLKTEKSDYAVMAIENTLAGSLLPNYSLITKNGFSIVGEVYLHIQMNLMALPGVALKDIRHIISHPVALAQCEEYLETLPDAEVIEFNDTAAAAKWVSDNNRTDYGAIGNLLSAKLYHLNILAENIETHKKNYTRFLVLSRKKETIEGANKASVSLVLPHTPGSLADVLQIFKENRVNLTKIQSVPIIGKPYQYAFKIDLTWDNYSDYLHTMELVRNYGSDILIMGEYKSEKYQ